MPTFRHGRGTKILFGSYDISEYFRDANVQTSADTADSTSFGADVKTYVIGMTDGRVTLSGMFSGGAGEVDEVLQAAFGQESPIAFTYAPEGLAAGRRVWGLNALETSYTIQGSVSDLVASNAEIQGTGGVKSGVSLLAPTTVLNATGQQTGVDTGYVADSNGGWAILHLLSNTVATSVAVKLQTSATIGGTYTDLVTFPTFTTNPNHIGSHWIPIPRGTTINQYVRAQYTVTGAGSFTAHASIMRAAL